MNQIWSNPSLQRNLILANGNNSTLMYCLKLTQKNTSTDATQDIIIFPNLEYSIKFYDANTGFLHSIICLVEDVYEDQIKVKYLKNNANTSTSSNTNCSKCTNTSCSANANYNTTNATTNTTVAGLSNCSCILNPPDVSKYEGPVTLFIPIMNIVSAAYVVTSNTSDTEEKEDNKDGGLYIMLLGISATTLRAIVIRMAFFEDNMNEAVKFVDLKAEGIYDLTYEAEDGAIYETRVKIMSIEEIDDGTPCKPGKGYVREHTGFGHGVYSNTECCSKDEFMIQKPVKKVRIIADTSEDFHGRYEAIMLDAIRDCVLVYDTDTDNTQDDVTKTSYCDCCEHKTTHCHPDYCGHFVPAVRPPHNGCKPNNGNMTNNTYVYTYDNIYKATIKGEKVQLNVKGEKTEITLDALVRYYLGVD